MVHRNQETSLLTRLLVCYRRYQRIWINHQVKTYRGWDPWQRSLCSWAQWHMVLAHQPGNSLTPILMGFCGGFLTGTWLIRSLAINLKPLFPPREIGGWTWKFQSTNHLVMWGSMWGWFSWPSAPTPSYCTKVTSLPLQKTHWSLS